MPPRQAHTTSEGDSYCVDWFGSGADLYFLSHMHTDHLVGIFKQNGSVTGEWETQTGAKIVCSEQTKDLLVARGLPGNRVVAKPMGEACFVPIGSGGPTFVLINANHCPGSVSFTLRGTHSSTSIRVISGLSLLS